MSVHGKARKNQCQATFFLVGGGGGYGNGKIHMIKKNPLLLCILLCYYYCYNNDNNNNNHILSRSHAQFTFYIFFIMLIYNFSCNIDERMKQPIMHLYVIPCAESQCTLHTFFLYANIINIQSYSYTGVFVTSKRHCIGKQLHGLKKSAVGLQLKCA